MNGSCRSSINCFSSPRSNWILALDIFSMRDEELESSGILNIALVRRLSFLRCLIGSWVLAFFPWKGNRKSQGNSGISMKSTFIPSGNTQVDSGCSPGKLCRYHRYSPGKAQKAANYWTQNLIFPTSELWLRVRSESPSPCEPKGFPKRSFQNGTYCCWL